MDSSPVPFSTEVCDERDNGHDKEDDVHDELDMGIVVVVIVTLVSQGVPKEEASEQNIDDIDGEVVLLGGQAQAAEK